MDLTTTDANRPVEAPEAITIVAEAAQGFEGRPVQAMLLVRAAAAAGADLVKFQLVYADELAAPSYQHYELFRTLEMPDEAWHAVAAEARRFDLPLSFDIYGPRALALAVALDAAALKVHSTDFFNGALVDAALATGRDVWFSIGGIRVGEVRAFLERHRPARANQLTLLYGFQAEPTETGDNHLRRLATLRAAFPGLALGFMDHADATSDEAGWLGMLALPYGVQLIEKHITIGRSLALEDSVSALDAVGFARYVRRIRSATSALGDPTLTETDVERRYRGRALKVVVAEHSIAAGSRLEPGDLTLKRAPIPAGVEPIHRIADVVGATVRRAIEADEPLVSADLSWTRR